MKLAALSFLLLLLAAHDVGDAQDPLGLPLSQFRDVEPAWPGYGLFGLLLAIGALYTIALARSRYEAEACIAGMAVLLLLVVALTDSLGVLHGLCSMLLLLLLFTYYGKLLYQAGGPWFLAHLTVPFALAFGTQLHSYGLWQKSFIVYCVLGAATHHHLLGRPAAPRRPAPGRHRGSTLPKRRKVYAVDLGHEWTRR
jgi:hypothetical protein